MSLAPGRRTGIIATNTIAQGDTREVGLDQATAGGWTVYRAVKSQPRLGTAAVIVSLLWLAGKLGRSEVPILDGNDVRGITPGLDPASRVSGTPFRLVANEAQSFQGSNVLGKGFILGDLRCTPSDVYETFPRPTETPRLHSAGEELERTQRAAMSDHGIGLASLYNRVHTRHPGRP
ncbi:hypothetical protein ACF09H_20785 [Streptomyces sp. NPDC014983]|uniref:hypothetical protein n=1 Tax=Streptomyces sp. NPDC014983 TaxID=3364933 RepID=UPI0036FCEB98